MATFLDDNIDISKSKSRKHITSTPLLETTGNRPAKNEAQHYPLFLSQLMMSLVYVLIYVPVLMFRYYRGIVLRGMMFFKPGFYVALGFLDELGEILETGCWSLSRTCKTITCETYSSLDFFWGPLLCLEGSSA
jgi:hypothetical protein